MKLLSILVYVLILLTPITGFTQRYWVSGSNANWSGNNWSSSSGGAPDGGGPPTAGVQAFFDANGTGNCNVDIAAAFDGLTTTGYTGIIDINGSSFAISGVNDCILAGGTINDSPGTSSIQINTSGIVRFSGTAFGAAINATGSIDFDGGTFNSVVTVNHDFSNQYGTGGCTFNGNLSITNASAFEIRLGNSSADTFNGTITLDNSGSSWIRLGYNSAGNIFNDDISISTSGSALGISFCEGGVGTGTFGVGVTVNVGSDFTAGDLFIESISQSDATNISLDLNGTARAVLQFSSFLGDLDIQAPRIYLRESTFDGDVYFEKEGATNDASYGGNTFNGTTHFHLTGSGYFLMGNNSADIWNDDLTLTNEGTEILYVAHNASGNQFNGNVIFECTSPNGIRVCNNSSGDAALAATKTLSLGALSFSDGLLTINRLTQSGATAQSLDLSGSSRIAMDDCTFDGDLTLSAPRLQFTNSTFNGNVDFTKEDATNDNSGGNTFNGSATFTHIGDNDWYFGVTNPDIFNGTVTFTTSGAATARILPSRSVGNQFNESVVFENNGSGGIYLGSNNGTSSLAAGKTLNIGGLGFNAGILYLYNITQADATPISLSPNGSTNTSLNNNSFLGDITISSPRLSFSGNTFDGITSLEKTDATNDDSNGGNTFNSTTTITNSGSGRILMASTNPDIFNGDLFVNNTGSDYIYLAHGAAGNQFNGNIELVNTTGNSIRFSQGAAGSSELANGKTITIGAGGFTNGNLFFYNFTQVGTTAQNLTLDNSSRLYMSGPTWEGNLVAEAGFVQTVNSTYEGTVDFTQNGSLANSSSSGNDFQDDVVLTNSGGNTFNYGVTDPDQFLGSVILNNTGSSTSALAYNSIGNTFAGDVNISNSGSGTGVYLGYSNAATTFAIAGNVVLNESSSTNATNGIANNGTGVISGDVTVTNNSTATSCYNYLGNAATSNLTIDGTTTLVNNGAATSNQDIRAGYSGTVVFNQQVIASNNSNATNSYIRFAYAGTATFNDDIELEATLAGCSGITFGENGGSASLAATKTVTVGAGGFIDGNLRFRNFTQIGATPQALTLSGTAYLYNQNSDWGGDVVFISPQHRTDGTTYSGTAYLEKSGATSNNSSGGNTFNDDAQLVHSGSDNFLLGNGGDDIVNGNLTINNNGTGVFYFAYTGSSSQINGNLDVTNSGSAGNTSFSNATSSTINITGDVNFTNNSNTSTANYFPNGGIINVDGNLTVAENATSGNSNFYLVSNAASSLSVGGDVDIQLNTTGTTGRMYLNNGGTILVDGNCSLSNSSTCTNSEFYVTNGAAAVSTFNGNLTIENYGAGSDGIYFGNANGATTLAATKVVTIGGNGFDTGIAQFRNFTQTGATAQSLTLSGDAYLYNLNSDWGGDVTFVAPRFRTDNTDYAGTAYLEKSGGIADDQSQGNNTFGGDVQLVNSGSFYFMMGANNPDTFGGNLTMDNVGTDNMFLAYSSAGNTIAGDLTINHNGSGQNVNIADGSASTLTIAGNTSIDYSTSHASATLYFVNNGTVQLAGDLTLTQATTGTTSNSYFSNGNNGSLTVNGTTTLTNNSTSATTGRIFLGSSGDVTLNGSLDIFNNATGTNAEVYVDYNTNSSGTFNGDIVLESIASSDGVRFGANGGNSTLADTYTITVGAGGFAGTYLEFRNFTQDGATAQNVITTGAATQINMRDALWNADASFTGARIVLRESTFEGISSFTKNGASTDASTGGNTFNDDVTFENASSSEFRLSGTNAFPDDYNANATFIESSTGELRPSYNNSDSFAGDIILNSANQIYFGVAGNGRVIMDGNVDQNITDLVGGVLHRMRDFEVSKTGGDVYLASNFDVVVDLELNNGIVYSDASNYILMIDNSNVAAVSNASHIDGPIDKVGNDAFTFPVGDNGFYRPISISNPTNTTARFSAQYFDDDADLAGYDDNSMEATLDYISDCEYWILNRLVTTNNVTVSLSYDSYSGACSGVVDPATVSVARWDAVNSIWRDHGNDGSATPNEIISNGAVTSFSPFTLGTNNYPTNPLPVELLSFEAIENGDIVDLNWQTASEINNDYFTIERSDDGINFYGITKIAGAGNSTTLTEYSTQDINPLSGTSYYRLKQTDFNGEYSFSNVEVVHMNVLSDDVIVFPNPLSERDRELTVRFTTTAERSLTIVDQLGKIVSNEIHTSDSEVLLSTTHLSKGVYFIKIASDSEFKMERFVLE
ncbi:MAG: T9SS type A sorting domain-containing protein [Flavobacteriales bacterium]|nr:T9SS type A sorting domain-containing protein [Flavobacteriales bacterium]MCB9196250.1 T9SS type A sorting domain-containing protein [Flavobacteriales bacterium]